MLETVHVVFEPTPDFFETVSMCHYRQVVRMSLLAVEGDVLRYIDLLQHVGVIVKHGVRYK